MTIPTNKIAFQGTYGAHSDIACRKAYPYHTSVPYPSFASAMKAVEDGEADLCMIPIENSKAGRVAEIHNLLPDTSLSIIGEYFLPIEHHLVGTEDSNIEKIKQIYSHPQALMQCSKTIEILNEARGKKNNIILNNHSNTAVACADIKKWNDPSKAAICSSLAAEINQLKILQSDMQDASDNTTVFIAMAKEPTEVDPKDGPVITSLLFTARNIPSSLYKALGGFATNNVNLLKIESYIPAGQSKTAQFFISFEGFPGDTNVRLALEELGFFCKKVKILGVYHSGASRR